MYLEINVLDKGRVRGPQLLGKVFHQMRYKKSYIWSNKMYFASNRSPSGWIQLLTPTIGMRSLKILEHKFQKFIIWNKKFPLTKRTFLFSEKSIQIISVSMWSLVSTFGNEVWLFFVYSFLKLLLLGLISYHSKRIWCSFMIINFSKDNDLIAV